jgi:hypothetical protein
MFHHKFANGLQTSSGKLINTIWNFGLFMHDAGNNNETKITNGSDAPLWSRFCFTLIQKFLLLDEVMPIDDKVTIACALQTVESHVQ